MGYLCSIHLRTSSILRVTPDANPVPQKEQSHEAGRRDEAKRDTKRKLFVERNWGSRKCGRMNTGKRLKILVKVCDALQVTGNNGTEQGGRAPFLPRDTGLGHPYCIFHRVAWSCPPASAGRHERSSHSELRASTVKSYKLNTKGQPAHWSRSQNNPIGIGEQNT